MPQIYMAHEGQASAGKTHYQGFVGKNAAFDGSPIGLRLPKDFPDGLSSTVFVVEAPAAVIWTKPDDLPFQPDQPLPKFGWARGSRTFEVLMGDGSVRGLSKQISEQSLRAAITRNGSDSIGPDWEKD
jgi:hypothetical protein